VLHLLGPHNAGVEKAVGKKAIFRCSLNATDWKRLCQEANATPAGRAAR
jgi:hypothetical protein